ncbi:hypothetical protein [Sporosarcina sp. BP05]|uniref:hypothetical protein n=1 Tax=Sporosarcina sp. BP05 TaxID=2758726 RepID=UPI0016448279|nr:hypothetical protein [Sporosarcina sp. BP05]
MKKYLYTLLEEKEIELDDTFDITAKGNLHIFEYGAIIEAILSTTEEEQQAIRKMLVQIDFANGSIKKYLQHLAQALI